MASAFCFGVIFSAVRFDPFFFSPETPRHHSENSIPKAISPAFLNFCEIQQKRVAQTIRSVDVCVGQRVRFAIAISNKDRNAKQEGHDFRMISPALNMAWPIRDGPDLSPVQNLNV